MKDPDLKNIKSIFFIGIGGIGISALAKLALARGIAVSGMNDEPSPKTLEPLREAGARIFYQKDLAALPEADMYVYSDAWLYRGPELIAAARATGKPVCSYFQALGQFARDYKVIAISGTHGKTTTTAMVAEILIEAGFDPTVIVGSFVKKFDSRRDGAGSNFRPGQGAYLVVEADEYNRHFLNFQPHIAVVTNIEADHLDYYKDLADVKDAFREFLSRSEHSITDYETYLSEVPALAVPGVHNRMNAAAALAVADALGINASTARRALAGFAGTWRRLEKRGIAETGTLVYDDYAHHPTEIRASIAALRDLYPKGQYVITVAFQPHLYSRTKAFFDEFGASFGDADRLLLLPIYFAREDRDESVSTDKLAVLVAEKGTEARAYPDFSSAAAAVRALSLGPKDVFVTMGAGEAYKIADAVFHLD